MHKQVDQWIDAHRDSLVCALQELIGFASISRAERAKPGAPFGPEVAEALVFTLSLCKSFGFETTDLDGYIGYADHGEGEEMLGILSHLDVVPEGEGWTKPPFGGVIEDGRLYGRGAMDDKGPAVASIFALAAIKSCDIPLRRRVRLLLGCDEECGMRCMQHYAKHRPLPDIAFSPDAEYPLVNSEKGIMHCAYTKPYASSLLLEAGSVVNAVPGKATAQLPLKAEEIEAAVKAFSEETGFAYLLSPGAKGASLVLIGKDAHASTPEAGKNALQAMLALFTRLPLPAADAAEAAALHAALGFDMHGERIGIDLEDESGRLTLNPGLMHWDEKGYRLDLDLRFPTGEDADAILARLDAAFSGTRSDTTVKAGHFVSEDSELVQKLLKVYEARSGSYLPPKKIGGGTYARCIQNAVAFGIEIPGQEARMHQPDEYIRVEDLIYHTKMMADAILALAAQE